MAHDARFGLPLSLEEALQADPSPEAATLVRMLAEADPPRRPLLTHSWRAWAAGALAAIGTAGVAHAGATLEGRWTMAAQGSSFSEALSGPAPDAATLVVSRDDGRRLTYEVVESRGGAEVARGRYDLSFTAAPSTTTVDGVRRRVEAHRDGAGQVEVRAPAVRGVQAVIRLRRSEPDVAVLDHEVEAPDGVVRVEEIRWVRAPEPAKTWRTAAAEEE